MCYLQIVSSDKDIINVNKKGVWNKVDKAITDKKVSQFMTPCT